jgi:hypothetical protein
MLKARVVGTRVNEVGESELTDSAHSLVPRRVDHGQFKRVELNVTMHRVTDGFEPHEFTIPKADMTFSNDAIYDNSESSDSLVVNAGQLHPIELPQLRHL